MNYVCNEGGCTHFSFTKLDLDIHRSVALTTFELPNVGDFTVRKNEKSRTPKQKGRRLKINNGTTSCAYHFIASSPLPSVNQNKFTYAENCAGSSSIQAKKLSAEKSELTGQANAPIAAEATEMLIGESFVGVDDEKVN